MAASCPEPAHVGKGAAGAGSASQSALQPLHLQDVDLAGPRRQTSSRHPRHRSMQMDASVPMDVRDEGEPARGPMPWRSVRDARPGPSGLLSNQLWDYWRLCVYERLCVYWRLCCWAGGPGRTDLPYGARANSHQRPYTRPGRLSTPSRESLLFRHQQGLEGGWTSMAGGNIGGRGCNHRRFFHAVPPGGRCRKERARSRDERFSGGSRILAFPSRCPAFAWADGDMGRDGGHMPFGRGRSRCADATPWPRPVTFSRRPFFSANPRSACRDRRLAAGRGNREGIADGGAREVGTTGRRSGNSGVSPAVPTACPSRGFFSLWACPRTLTAGSIFGLMAWMRESVVTASSARSHGWPPPEECAGSTRMWRRCCAGDVHLPRESGMLAFRPVRSRHGKVGWRRDGRRCGRGVLPRCVSRGSCPDRPLPEFRGVLSQDAAGPR
jgi:hypothetical protein